MLRVICVCITWVITVNIPRDNFGRIQGSSIKTERHTSHVYGWNNWYQWMRYLLLRKMVTRSAILVHSFVFYGTFHETMSRPQVFPFQLKLGVNECHFGLPQLVIHLTCQCALLRAGFWCKECTLINLIWLLPTTMASRNGIHSALV